MHASRARRRSLTQPAARPHGVRRHLPSRGLIGAVVATLVALVAVGGAAEPLAAAATPALPTAAARTPAPTAAAPALPTAAAPAPGPTAAAPALAPRAAAVAGTYTVLRDRAGRLSVVRDTRGLPRRSVLRALGGTVVTTGTDHAAYALGEPDPRRGEQWALDALNDTWSDLVGPATKPNGDPVVVAVVDSGVDDSHQDLDGQVLDGAQFLDPQSTVPDLGNPDGKGHVTCADAAGSTGCAHGTHVAGIIAALANNGRGGRGLAPAVKILPVRVLGSDGSGWMSDVAAGIIYAVDNGADVVNVSLGGSSADPGTSAALTYAGSHGVLVVASAGNDALHGNDPSYPAADPKALAVAATTSTDSRAGFSSYGSYVDLAAPGVDILSTVPGGHYERWSGTSMAAPYVAAAAALLRAASPTATVAELTAALEGAATDLGTPGRDDQFGFGLVDPVRARCATTCPTDPALRTLTLDPVVDRARTGQPVTVAATLSNAVDGLPLAGQRVDLVSSTGSSTVSSTLESQLTDAEGHVTVTRSSAEPESLHWRAPRGWDGTLARAEALSAVLRVTDPGPDPTTLTLTAAPGSLSPGQTAALTAELTNSYDGSRPSGTDVVLSSRPAGSSDAFTVVTDSSTEGGVAQFAVIPQSATDYRACSAGTSDLAAACASLTVAILLPDAPPSTTPPTASAPAPVPAPAPAPLTVAPPVARPPTVTLTAASTTVYSGQRTTLTSTVTGGGGARSAGVPVTFSARPSAGSAWSARPQATRSNGTSALSVAPIVTTTYRVCTSATAALTSACRQLRVTVRAVVKVSARKVSTRAVRITGRATPATSSRVYLQKLVGKRWRSLASSAGATTVTFTVASTTATTRYRLYLRTSSRATAAVSFGVTVRR